MTEAINITKESSKAATSELNNTTIEKSLCIDEPSVMPSLREIKGDVDALALLCIEIAKLLHDTIGVEATQEILFDSRGQQ